MIKESTFLACGELLNVNISNGVKEIWNYAFAECIDLTSITIPNTVTIIDPEVFLNCRSLKTSYYQGTESQWRQIEKAKDWDKGTGNYQIKFLLS